MTDFSKYTFPYDELGSFMVWWISIIEKYGFVTVYDLKSYMAYYYNDEDKYTWVDTTIGWKEGLIHKYIKVLCDERGNGYGFKLNLPEVKKID